MTSESPTAGEAEIHIGSVEELVSTAEISDVVFHEVSARRLTSDNDEAGAKDNEAHDLQVAVRSGSRDLEVRCRIDGEFFGGKYVVDVSVCYELKLGGTHVSGGNTVISTDALNVFVSNVGIMAAYPFLREALHQSGSRLGLKPPVLPLLRLGNYKVKADDSTPDWTF